MAVHDTPLASLSLTHVYYDPNDGISLICAYLALVPQALCIVYATLVLASREAEVVLALVGQVACEALNLLLKRAIKQRRPRRFHDCGYGMPSSHAQFLAFWAAQLVLFVVFRHQPRQRAARWQRGLTSVAAVLLAAAVAWSRVYLGYHSPAQVLVGCGAGAACALAWFALTAALRSSGWLRWALDLPPARALRARDLALDEDLCQAGWEKWQRRRAQTAVAAQEKKTP
ncbi:hypothetical protein CDD82_6325 [Ophiocordyceps australis]|uniref:Dolichyldiphosphatase n=1 Tax=Ophiocordyceps australis TaxID=1399860 RepID=A0A2C5YQM3_9HYPO|nr:hypothetical protein CDD82_6325 [Ophiocordyceps australis]